MNHNTKLQIIIGPMFSGKSTELIRLIREYKFIEAKIMVIKHSLDDSRYERSKLCTHDKQTEDCLSTNNLMNLTSTKEYLDAEVIFIEEAQFFDNLFEFVSEGLNEKKSFVVAGLDGDFKRNPFGDILKLIPLAEKVVKLNALCFFCKNGTEAPFTKRLIQSQDQQLVGGADSYASVCRYHYENKCC
ncbi:Thymidine kinase [seawater metagenome]|uniref:thymidine kinase n=1 Tax=seawater metagenome TaxID=1561972 RepID=A0A5E8CI94_9ZZZZ